MHKLTRAYVKSLTIASVLLLAIMASFAQAKSLHEDWSTLLAANVSTNSNGHNTLVDYQGFLTQRVQLKAYLKALENVSQSEFDQWNNNEKLAFLINAYNAWTVELILSKYPNLESIRDLGGFFTSPWEKSFIPLLGKARSLDDIEHTLIRGGNKYQEPRIHFAVNCASIGCPALREEAFVASKLEAQLEQQTLRFLSDKSRNKIENKQLYLSSIFKWYKDDFELGFKGADSLESFLLLYSDAIGLTNEQRQALKNKDVNIDYLDYDWQLNDKRK